MKPTTTGIWCMRSEETGEEWYTVEIFEQDGILMVNDPDIGIYQLDHYHDNLVDIEWQKDTSPI